MKPPAGVAIVGVHATEQALRLPGRTSQDLAQEAVFGALADAGLDRSDVDGVLVDWSGPGGREGNSSSWATLLGGPFGITTTSMMDNAGARGLGRATGAIMSGQADVVVVGGGAAGMFDGPLTGGDATIETSDPFGAYVVPHFALVAQRHCFEHGTTPEQLALVAATIRNQGHSNPEAMMYGRGPYTVDDVLSSRMVSSPLHLLDVCIMGEGGAAFVVTSIERARDLAGQHVEVMACASDYAGSDYDVPAQLREVGLLGRRAFERCLGQAGLDRADIDLLSIYDPNSFEVIRQLEAFGFCPVGEGGHYVEDQGVGPGSRLPVNVDGGCLSYAWNGTQQMTLRVIEAVRQLRGTAVHPVDGARTALVANAGSGARHQELALLGVDE